jgi:hypothetical protein
MGYAFMYSIGGLLVGGSCVLVSALLLHLRRNGKNSWICQFGRVRIEITTDTPAIILATIGLLIILITRFGSS